jgi:hypothetical protein
MPSSHSSIALACATAFLLTIFTNAQEDPFHDTTQFPTNPSQSSFRVQSLSSDPNTATCNPSTDPPVQRTYDLVDEPGPGCSYQSFIDYYTTSPSRTDGSAECASHCDASASCRAFNWFLDSATPDIGNCELANGFYDPAVVECGVEGNTNTYLGVWNATDWATPPEIMGNGGFETGCLEPWFFSDFTSDESLVPTAINCEGSGDCAPGGGCEYLRITGNGENGSTRDKIDAYIGQKPALEDDVQYRLSASVRAPVGSVFRFTYPVHTSVVIRSEGTGEWVDVEGSLDGQVSFELSCGQAGAESDGLLQNTGTFLIQMDAPSAADFAIDNVKIEAI